MNRISIFRYITTLCFLFASSSGSWAQPSTHFLGDVFTDKGQSGLSVVRDEASTQSTSTPRYKSNSVETRWYEGYFHPDSSTTKLALLSDDGSSVWIDDVLVLDRADKNQGFHELDSTFTALNASFEIGQSYHIRIKYTNTIHLGDADVDGLTLWAYDGGGEVTTDEFPDFTGNGDTDFGDSSSQQSVASQSIQQQAVQQQSGGLGIPTRQLVMLHHARVSISDGGRYKSRIIDGDRVEITWNGANPFTRTITLSWRPVNMSLILKPGQNELFVRAVSNGKRIGCTPLISFIPQHVWSGRTSSDVELIALPFKNRSKRALINTVRFGLRFPTVTVSRAAHPQSAAHIAAAQAAGKPIILTCDANAARSANRRARSLAASGLKPWGQLTAAEKASYNNIAQDRDEYPMAMFKENAGTASVRYVSFADNRGAGSVIKNQTLPFRTRFFNAKVQMRVGP